MSKEESLEIIKLLAALESWSFADKHHLPDYLYDRIDKAIDLLSEQLLKA